MTETGDGGRDTKGLRAAIALCYVAGGLSLLIALFFGVPALIDGTGSWPLVVGYCVGGVLAIVGGWLLSQRRRVALLVLVVASVGPWLTAYFLQQHTSNGGSVLVLGATLYALTRVGQLR